MNVLSADSGFIRVLRVLRGLRANFVPFVSKFFLSLIAVMGSV